ncbi:RNA methyltransferase [Thermococcus thioreducens]|uniref:RNA methyltransferase n=1 Tax=Thermococcus thioreducens TaxID=277988 RepID=A0A0Q2QTG4_9EURY|nr:RNA methyltransferase [Thermococcus thioreducens]ASJ13287.1 RNA methyltransferase [Thermococcus thioreducens]KQH83301.1 RNA methyltransferase [Thermococcus thioreducens]SEW22134.1 RNA methyltransferase, TrmH family, group 1 [Thermococcus thioreducens]
MISVVLVEPEGPANIGMVARTMKNFGFSRLVLVNPNITEESYSYAVHAVDVLEDALILESFEEALELFDLSVGTTGKPGKSYIPERAPLMPWELRETIRDYPGRVGLFFGRESIGLKNEELERLDFTVTIPTSEAYPVMNIAQSVAVILYELAKRKPEAKVHSLEPATRGEKDELVNAWEKLLEVLNYPKDAERRAIFVKIFRRFVGRAALYGREVHTLIGPLRKAAMELEECRNAER